MTWQPKLRPKGFPHTMDEFAVASLAELEHCARSAEDKRDQRVFRVKRKHVLKACDRCRVKKTKCDGKQPCNRCSVYNHPCLFRERKATQTKVYSRGFVEMLESHHSLVVKALQKLYKFCVDKEGFPGEPLAAAPDGHPLTHAILDRLGLIKQAEENADDPDEDSDELRYLRLLSTSTECSATAEPSPEPGTPPEPSPTTLSPSGCNPIPIPMNGRNSSWPWDLQPMHPGHHYHYPDQGYHDMSMSIPRSSLGPADIGPNKLSPHVDVASGSSVHQGYHPESTYSYFLDECYAADEQNPDVKPSVGHLGSAVLAESLSHQIQGGLSGDLLHDLHFHQESSFYPRFSPGWTFLPG